MCRYYLSLLELVKNEITHATTFEGLQEIESTGEIRAFRSDASRGYCQLHFTQPRISLSDFNRIVGDLQEFYDEAEPRIQTALLGDNSGDSKFRCLLVLARGDVYGNKMSIHSVDEVLGNPGLYVTPVEVCYEGSIPTKSICKVVFIWLADQEIVLGKGDWNSSVVRNAEKFIESNNNAV